MYELPECGPLVLTPQPLLLWADSLVVVRHGRPSHSWRGQVRSEVWLDLPRVRKARAVITLPQAMMMNGQARSGTAWTTARLPVTSSSDMVSVTGEVVRLAGRAGGDKWSQTAVETSAGGRKGWTSKEPGDSGYMGDMAGVST